MWLFSLFKKNKKKNGNVGLPSPRAHTGKSVHFFNTFSGKKELFVPKNQPDVSMYTCGPTVYDYAHIGNLRSYVFSDIVRRTLEYNGFKVIHVINVTDVGHLTSDADEGEDKMTAALKREGKPLTIRSMRALGQFYTKKFKEDLEKLNILPPHEMPRPSDYIDEQIVFIKTLSEKGYTYKTSDGIYFETSRFPEYGKLGRGDREEVKTKARVEKKRDKKNPADFALWKFGAVLGWKSPWGLGFPGWHIECSTMAMNLLGKELDIHTGGMDHIPIHHNNEIAQTESVTGKRFVKYWMHNAFITLDKQKIAKSLGNTIFLRNLKDRGFAPLAYRYWLLTGHYRTPLNFTWEALEGAQTAFSRLLVYFVEELGVKKGEINQSYQERFLACINDDLDTPRAIALLWELIKDEGVSKPDKRATLLDFDHVLGFGLKSTDERLLSLLSGKETKIAVSEAPKHIQKLVGDREIARENKDWEKADKLRGKIQEKGYSVEDTDEGPLLKKRADWLFTG